MGLATDFLFLFIFEVDNDLNLLPSMDFLWILGFPWSLEEFPCMCGRNALDVDFVLAC